MSVQSKFFQVTNLILLEYSTDLYKITVSKAKVGADATSVYMYQGKDGNQYCIENNSTTIQHEKYPDETDSTYYYGGINPLFELDTEVDSSIYGRKIWLNDDNDEGTIILDKNGYEERKYVYKTTDEGVEQKQAMYINHDTIRLYILTGYVMNSIGGYSLSVKAPVNLVSYTDAAGNTVCKRIKDYLYLLNWYMPKEELKDNIHWLANPLYLNSKFYDRYIEIKFPSPLDCAINDRNIDYVYEYTLDDGDSIYMRGKINDSAAAIIEFATVLPSSITNTGNSIHNYESYFYHDLSKEIAISKNSNANNFNIKMYEDVDAHCIQYYPIYGDLENEEELDIDMMLAIDQGIIPMIDNANVDNANNGIDDFIEMYGDDVFKWVIINELQVAYNYQHINHNDTQDNTETYTEYYTNTIDYTGKTSSNGQFWHSKFIPFIKERNNMSCKSIVIQYTAHLFNRMNNVDIVRTGSMTIKNPYKYTLTTINTNNIMQYKIVNKVVKNQLNAINNTTNSATTQLVRSFYDTTNILAKGQDDNTYSNGKLTLYLKHTNSNYVLKLYTTNSDNTRIPYDLTGTTDYKLVFPSASGSKIEIFPTKDSTAYNLNIGQMIFYITSDKANAIMSVPSSERYFAITTHIANNSQEETSLYEGKVEWIS